MSGTHLVELAGDNKSGKEERLWQWVFKSPLITLPHWFCSMSDVISILMFSRKTRNTLNLREYIHKFISTIMAHIGVCMCVNEIKVKQNTVYFLLLLQAACFGQDGLSNSIYYSPTDNLIIEEDTDIDIWADAFAVLKGCRLKVPWGFFWPPVFLLSSNCARGSVFCLY